MDGETWNRIKQLFHEAAARPAAEREAFLDEACGGDPRARAEVEALLASHEELGEEPERPTADARRAPEQPGTLERPGTMIGRYKLLQEIGEGGFGAVYMAEQEEPVRRKVAVKIIKLGMDTRQVIARFEAERQALAIMDHPHIARVLDAGATDTGRPYFVMELVRGIPITEYCDQNNLSTRKRLELFTAVCSAIQHAHQKGIIHRDIKPTNVMVTLHDGRPVPKVIDFGIAKATNQRLTEKTLFTEYHQFIGTPEYMSPEQAEMSGLDIDTRTDIYSLGVLLYELLTGTTPFDPKRLRSMAYADIQRAIREEEPHKPSTRLSTLGERATTAARHQRTDVQALSKALRGDLDWIVMKALEKDRTRRYETASGLMLDIKRHLAHEAVLASPPTPAYRLSKFIRRNRTAVSVGAVVALTLLVGFVLATFGFVQASRERAVARREAESARAINAFFNDMLASVDPQQLRLYSGYAPEGQATPELTTIADHNVSVAEMMRRAGGRIGSTFGGKPELEATARETIGLTLLGLGFPGDALPQLRAALEIRRRGHGDDHPETLRSMLQLAHALSNGGSNVEAESVLRAALEDMRRVYGPEHPITLQAASGLASVLMLQSRHTEADPIFRDALDAQRRVLGDEHRDVLWTMCAWASSYCWRGRGADAEALASEALETARRNLSPDAPVTLQAESGLGWAYTFLGEYDKGEALLRETLQKHQRILGADHPEACTVMMGLGRCLERTADGRDETEQLWRQALAGLRTHWGEANPTTWVISRDLAYLLLARGKDDEALRILRRQVDAWSAAYGEDDRWAVGSRKNLIAGLRAAGRDQEARSLVAEVISASRAVAEGPEATADDLNDYAWFLLTCHPADLRDPAAALPVAVGAVEASGGEDWGVLDTAARAYAMTGDLDRAVEIQTRAAGLMPPGDSGAYRKVIRELVRYLTRAGDDAAVGETIARRVDVLRDHFGKETEAYADALTSLGRDLSECGLHEAAEPLLREALHAELTVRGADHERTAASKLDLAAALLPQGRRQEAEQLLGDCRETVGRLHGGKSLEAAEALQNIGRQLYGNGDAAGAALVIREALDLFRRHDTGDSLEVLRAGGRLAGALAATGALDEAESLARGTMARCRETLGDHHDLTAHAMQILGQVLVAKGDPVQAEPILRDAVDALRRQRFETLRPWRLARAENTLGHCLTRLRRFEEAEALLLHSHDVLRTERGSRFFETRRALERLIALYEARGEPDRAAEWRSRLGSRP